MFSTKNIKILILNEQDKDLSYNWQKIKQILANLYKFSKLPSKEHTVHGRGENK